MRLGRFIQGEAERKRYEVVFNDWLNEDEFIASSHIEVETNSDGFIVDGYLANADGKSLAFYASGGAGGEEYKATITIETTMAQVKEDWVVIAVAGD